MRRTNWILARILSGITVMVAIAAVCATTRAQSPVPSADGRSQTDPPAIAAAAPGQVFSISKAESVKNPLADAEETGGGAQTRRAGATSTVCKRVVHAEVVALAQPFMLNRLGAAMPNGLIFALKRDVSFDAQGKALGLKDYKRARPIVLRANEGDCLEITLENDIVPYNLGPNQIPGTTQVSIHVQGMQLVDNISDDGSFVGRNQSSLAPIAAPPGNKKIYKLFAEHEGTFLLYTEGDSSTLGGQLQQGLFGAVNVQPATAEWYRSQVAEDDLTRATSGHTPLHQPTVDYDALYPANYNPTHSPTEREACTPILKMLDREHVVQNGKCVVTNDANLKMYHTDLTAIITGPSHGRFAGTTGSGPNAKPEPNCNSTAAKSATFDPLFCVNSASPDRKQPYREVTSIYHEVTTVASQAFPIMSLQFQGQPPSNVTDAGIDGFAINYGTGGIGSEIFANRIGVGPMGNCVDCKFEEFFLSAWSVADPAMVVDTPANSNIAPNHNADSPCTTTNLNSTNPNCVPDPGTKTFPVPGHPDWYHMAVNRKATKALYPDDPSNVYHSYLNDHLKFRILHGGTGITHIHHQHAHQWMESPNNSESAYLDSQMISPGASYTLEMVYNGSGNRNKTAGDSIFHCHFYPHFAAGMWGMWRVHDVFEQGTKLDKDGKPDKNAGIGARAYPDGEIAAGTPIIALVPLPTRPMPLMPSLVFIDDQAGPHQGQVVYNTPASPDFTGDKVTENPGYPFFIPGIAGGRAPHPPLDFAPNGDGGLPRHLITDGTTKNEQHTAFDWSKDFGTLTAKQLSEDGTNVEQVAMKFFGQRCRETFLPDGSPNDPFGPSNSPECLVPTKANFILNGLPRKNPAGTPAEKLGAQHGAPFADPAVDDLGKPIGTARIYKAAALQTDVTFNYLKPDTVAQGGGRKPGWHYPQERMLALWKDVLPTLNYKPGGPVDATHRQPEPLFFRADSLHDYIEYWHTNLVPNYYLVDNFQVRTPTDILGQHIHLVKFDVTSSDGAANGFNYEDGTFSPEEVQELIHAINIGGGMLMTDGTIKKNFVATPPPSDIIDCAANPGDPHCKICPEPPTEAQCPSWVGTQTTIQRWWPDPLLDNPPPGVKPTDRTIRTVFTHDHFGPSTHQQAGLYAGLLVEPTGSTWLDSSSGAPFGGRSDGGPTSWEAIIKTNPNPSDSYREFALEYQDIALAYRWYNGCGPNGTDPCPMKLSNDPSVGYRDNADNAINSPINPTLISSGGLPIPGTFTTNYMSDPIPWRTPFLKPADNNCDLSRVFQSNCTQATNLPAIGDPKTPLMRAYENDKIQVRLLVGAHTLTHYFTMAGPKWLAEPSWKDSGYRSSQGTGISEHFELLFNAPSSSKLGSARACPDGTSPGDCVDYLYSSSNDQSGMTAGMWGIFRAYDPTKPSGSLQPLPNNPLKPGKQPDYRTCPANANIRHFKIAAVTAERALAGAGPNAGQINFNDTNPSAILRNDKGIMYVFSADIDAQGRLKPGTPVEPLIMRAAAGDCIDVELENQMGPNSLVFKTYFPLPTPFASNEKRYASTNAGLSPQLLSFDGATSSGVNIGYNQSPQNQNKQSVAVGEKITYTWYAGNVDRDQTGALKYTPVEFGGLNLFPADPLMQQINALFGAMVVEPAGAKWSCDKTDAFLHPENIGSYKGTVPCQPGDAGYAGAPATRASATVTAGTQSFREFVPMVTDDLLISANNTSSVNYKTDPTFFRYGNPDPTRPTPPPIFDPNGDNNCAISNALPTLTPLGRDPATPIFGAVLGTPTRFRVLHPSGVGTTGVFTVNGHIWAREPYINDSTAIGNNKQAQWMGSHDQFGSTDHFEMVIANAGGKAGVPGDYLYTTFLPSQNRFGSWGVFRVVKLDTKGNPIVPVAPKDCQADPNAKPEPAPKDNLQRFIRQPIQSIPQQ
jgi:hypothetical protein